MSTRFADMLDRKAEDIKAPPVIPIGHYLFQVRAHPENEEVKSVKTRSKILARLPAIECGLIFGSTLTRMPTTPASQH